MNVVIIPTQNESRTKGPSVRLQVELEQRMPDAKISLSAFYGIEDYIDVAIIHYDLIETPEIALELVSGCDQLVILMGEAEVFPPGVAEQFEAHMGNKPFRVWHDDLTKIAEQIVFELEKPRQ